MTPPTPWSDLTPLPGEVGGWLAPWMGEWATVTGTVPDGFAAYAVLPNGWPDATLSGDAAQRLRAVLATQTTPDEPCVQALWEGYGELGGGTRLVSRPAGPLRRLAQRVGWWRPGLIPEHYRDELVATEPRLLPQEVEELSRFEIPNRAYYAFEAVLADLTPRARSLAQPDEQSPTLFWPRSRTWLLASEIDLAVTLVGGPHDLIAALTADAGLRADRVAPDRAIDPAWDLDAD